MACSLFFAQLALYGGAAVALSWCMDERQLSTDRHNTGS